MSVVFVIQKTHRMDEKSGDLVPKFDLSPAERFGMLVYMLSPTARPFTPGPVIRDLKRSLEAYDPDSDYLMLIGNPALIGFAVAIIARRSNRVRLLQWDGVKKEYVPIVVDFDDEQWKDVWKT